MQLPIFKLKLVRAGAIAFPRIDLNQPQLAAYFFHRMIGQGAVEHAAAIFLDPVHEFVGSTIFSVGDLARVEVVGREAFKAAILANASGVILGHNHPSNSSEPSAGDIRATRRLIRAGSILGINVLDHIITTPSSGFTSMREAGHLLLWWPPIKRVPSEPAAASEPRSASGNRP